MNLDQNTCIWILVCISVIYCCIKVNAVGFLCIILGTAILLYLKKELSLEPYESFKTDIVSSKQVLATPNPNKKNEEPKDEQENVREEPPPVKTAEPDTERDRVVPKDRFVLHGGQDYQQYKRLLESVAKDNEKYKKDWM